jgi:UDP-2,3-diacylglucosamine pyrophosphatase LpxH
MPLFKRASKLSEDEYQEAIDNGLNRAFKDAKPHQDKVDISDLKAVVFSDHHRGARDKADDFMCCDRAYSAALGWYLEQEFELWLLGDVEELWENGIDEVLPCYHELLELEREFARGPGLRRFYGNHDLDWKEPDRVECLAGWLPGVTVQEALRLQILDGNDHLGLLFLVHGHQGTLMSDRRAWISRRVLRHVWRPIQRAQRFLSTTPSQNHDLRETHDKAMYNWARRRVMDGAEGERPVLIAGHTHHPVFPGEPPKRPTSADAAELQDKLDKERNEAKRSALRAELELVRAVLREEPYDPSSIDPPCYFNTGCCCFPDSDVTCLEISGEPLEDSDLKDQEDGRGKIRLMRWLNNLGEPRPQERAASPLRTILDRVSAAA